MFLMKCLRWIKAELEYSSSMKIMKEEHNIFLGSLASEPHEASRRHVLRSVGKHLRTCHCISTCYTCKLIYMARQVSCWYRGIQRFSSTAVCQSAARPLPNGAAEANHAGREWLKTFSASTTIPRNICDISFSRSSGPGGQNVNK